MVLSVLSAFDRMRVLYYKTPKGGAMQKQTSLRLALFAVVLSVVPVHVSKADTGLRMSDITSALQSEYQTHLKKSPPISNTRRIKAEREILADYQRLLSQSSLAKTKGASSKAKLAKPKVVARPVAEKPPAPDAEDFFNAASNGDINGLSRMLQQGISVNVANHQKETALHMAAARGHYSAVIFLIKNGANPFARTVKKWLALHHATRFRHANIANYLMKRGLSPHFRTSDGYSSIDMARTNNDRRLLSIFGAR